MDKEEKIKISVNEEDVQNIINCYEKDIEYIKHLQQENKQLQEELKCTIGIVEHNRIISEKNKEIHQLKDNWNKLKEFIVKEYCIYLPLAASTKSITILIDKMQELEKGSDNNGQ